MFKLPFRTISGFFLHKIIYSRISCIFIRAFPPLQFSNSLAVVYRILWCFILLQESHKKCDFSVVPMHSCCQGQCHQLSQCVGKAYCETSPIVCFSWSCVLRRETLLVIQVGPRPSKSVQTPEGKMHHPVSCKHWRPDRVHCFSNKYVPCLGI